jgi:hypothetical protein
MERNTVTILREIDPAIFTALDELPDDLAPFQPLTTDDIVADFKPVEGGQLRHARYGMRDGQPSGRFVFGHHDREAITEDLRAIGWTVRRVYGQVWILTFRHSFTCPAGGNVDPTTCGCAGDDGETRWQATVPAGTPGAVAATVFHARRLPPELPPAPDLPPNILSAFQVCRGIRVIAFGDDGNMLLALGHNKRIDVVRSFAGLVRRRADWSGFNRPVKDVMNALQVGWATFTTDEAVGGPGFVTYFCDTEKPGTVPVTVLYCQL